MSVSLGGEPSRREGGPRPTEHQLRAAEIRSAATGESVEYVLSVFMGVGRHGGTSAAALAPAPEPPLEDDTAQLAPVISLFGTRDPR